MRNWTRIWSMDEYNIMRVIQCVSGDQTRSSWIIHFWSVRRTVHNFSTTKHMTKSKLMWIIRCWGGLPGIASSLVILGVVGASRGLFVSFLTVVLLLVDMLGRSQLKVLMLTVHPLGRVKRLRYCLGWWTPLYCSALTCYSILFNDLINVCYDVLTAFASSVRPRLDQNI